MMYILFWNIEEKYHSCAGDYESLFHIYLAIKEKYKSSITQTRDMYIQCNNAQGQPIDLKGGIYPKLAAKGYEKTLITKGLQNYRKVPV